MDKQTDLISRLQDEADLCRNDGASDIAALLDEATEALRVERVVLAELALKREAEAAQEWRLVAWVELDGALVWHDRAAATGRNLYARMGPND